MIISLLVLLVLLVSVGCRSPFWNTKVDREQAGEHAPPFLAPAKKKLIKNDETEKRKTKLKVYEKSTGTRRRKEEEPSKKEGGGAPCCLPPPSRPPTHLRTIYPTAIMIHQQLHRLFSLRLFAVAGVLVLLLQGDSSCEAMESSSEITSRQSWARVPGLLSSWNRHFRGLSDIAGTIGEFQETLRQSPAAPMFPGLLDRERMALSNAAAAPDGPARYDAQLRGAAIDMMQTALAPRAGAATESTTAAAAAKPKSTSLRKTGSTRKGGSTRLKTNAQGKGSKKVDFVRRPASSGEPDGGSDGQATATEAAQSAAAEAAINSVGVPKSRIATLMRYIRTAWYQFRMLEAITKELEPYLLDCKKAARKSSARQLPPACEKKTRQELEECITIMGTTLRRQLPNGIPQPPPQFNGDDEMNGSGGSVAAHDSHGDAHSQQSAPETHASPLSADGLHQQIEELPSRPTRQRPFVRLPRGRALPTVEEEPPGPRVLLAKNMPRWPPGASSD